MLIITSPTKQMKWNAEVLPETNVSFPEESIQIIRALQKLTLQDIMERMHVNEKIAKENLERYATMNIDLKGSSAIHTYQGIQFQYMKIQTCEELAYLQQHLRILSAVYGIVKPLDSIYLYRLEMQTKLFVKEDTTMVHFWKDTLAQSILKELQQHDVPILLNVASKEYSKAVLPYLPSAQVVTLTFQIRKNGKCKSESTQAKMARGRMVHYLASQQIETLQGVKAFQEDGYRYHEELSQAQEYVFIKEAAS